MSYPSNDRKWSKKLWGKLLVGDPLHYVAGRAEASNKSSHLLGSYDLTSFYQPSVSYGLELSWDEIWGVDERLQVAESYGQHNPQSRILVDKEGAEEEAYKKVKLTDTII